MEGVIKSITVTIWTVTRPLKYISSVKKSSITICMLKNGGKADIE
jgi:hypothetical protein